MNAPRKAIEQSAVLVRTLSGGLKMRMWLACALVVLLLGIGCGEEQGATNGDSVVAAPAQQVLSVFVVSYPLRYFAERIGGAHVHVDFPVPADVDPAYWSPGPETIAAYQNADLILLNGAGYAGWVELVSLSQARLVDTSASFADRLIPLESGPAHSHGPEGEHTHAGHAFTTWLDPTLAVEHAKAISAAFSRARPEESELFVSALDDLVADLGDLDQRLSSLWSRVGDAPVLFSHPIYQYLVRRYELNGRSVHWEPDEAPDEDMWRELETLLAGHPARWMIWESEPLGATRTRLEAMGVGSLVLRPNGGAPESDNLLDGLLADVVAIEAVLSDAEASP